MARFSIGVDLGGTNLRVAAVDESGTLMEKISTSTQVSLGRDQVLDEMCRIIQSLATRFNSHGPLAGVGIGVPGIIDMESGMLRESPNLPGWANYPVQQEIERRLGTSITLENDANAAAFGEHWLGAGQPVDSLCMLTLGTGVGGGIVLNNQIWHGMTGMAGEAGHINVEPDGHPCGCGSHGCIEQYASATAIKRMAMEAIATGKAPQLARRRDAATQAMKSDPEFSAKAIYNLAIQGDEPARKIFEDVGRRLGIVLAGLVNLLNLPMYVIGGGVSSAWDAFAPAMLREVQARSFVYAATNRDEHAKHRTIITRALLGTDAGLFGAARLPLVAPEAISKEAVRQ
jgi:glucokinase